MPHGIHDSSSLMQVTGLKPHHFADLIRIAQLVADPTCAQAGRSVRVDWEALGICAAVHADLRQLGDRFLYSTPNVSPVLIWEQLTPVSRAWLIENRHGLAAIEAHFPPRDED